MQLPGSSSGNHGRLVQYTATCMCQSWHCTGARTMHDAGKLYLDTSTCISGNNFSTYMDAEIFWRGTHAKISKCTMYFPSIFKYK